MSAKFEVDQMVQVGRHQGVVEKIALNYFGPNKHMYRVRFVKNGRDWYAEENLRETKPSDDIPW